MDASPLSSLSWRRNASRRRAHHNVAVVSHAQYVLTVTAAPTSRVKAAVTLTFDRESGVRVTCDVGYLYASFGLPMPLCFRVRPDVRDRRQKTYVRQALDVRQTSDKSIA